MPPFVIPIGFTSRVTLFLQEQLVNGISKPCHPYLSTLHFKILIDQAMNEQAGMEVNYRQEMYKKEELTLYDLYIHVLNNLYIQSFNI